MAPRTHAPDLELHAVNQMPKTRDWENLKLFHYDGTNLYQWFGFKGESVFLDPCDQPFAIVVLP